MLKKVSTFPGVLKHPINFLQFPFVHTLTVREGAVFGPRVGYSLLSVSFHTIICENGPNKFQMSQNISFARKCFGENSQKRLVFGDELEERLQAKRVVGEARGERLFRKPR